MAQHNERAKYEQQAAEEALGSPNPLVRSLAGLTHSDRDTFAGAFLDLLRAPREVEQTPAPKWSPDARIETLRRYAQSPFDNERGVARQNRTAIAAYEAGLREHLSDGGPLPAGVLPLTRADVRHVGSW